MEEVRDELTSMTQTEITNYDFKSSTIGDQPNGIQSLTRDMVANRRLLRMAAEGKVRIIPYNDPD